MSWRVLGLPTQTTGAVALRPLPPCAEGTHLDCLGVHRQGFPNFPGQVGLFGVLKLYFVFVFFSIQRFLLG